MGRYSKNGIVDRAQEVVLELDHFLVRDELGRSRACAFHRALAQVGVESRFGVFLRQQRSEF